MYLVANERSLDNSLSYEQPINVPSTCCPHLFCFTNGPPILARISHVPELCFVNTTPTPYDQRDFKSEWVPYRMAPIPAAMHTKTEMNGSRTLSTLLGPFCAAGNPPPRTSPTLSYRGP
ncbi:unnamed protein product [Ectocarpus sp. 12 AP-2014]